MIPLHRQVEILRKILTFKLPRLALVVKENNDDSDRPKYIGIFYTLCEHHTHLASCLFSYAMHGQGILRCNWHVIHVNEWQKELRRIKGIFLYRCLYDNFQTKKGCKLVPDFFNVLEMFFWQRFEKCRKLVQHFIRDQTWTVYWQYCRIGPMQHEVFYLWHVLILQKTSNWQSNKYFRP